MFPIDSREESTGEASIFLSLYSEYHAFAQVYDRQSRGPWAKKMRLLSDDRGAADYGEQVWT